MANGILEHIAIVEVGHRLIAIRLLQGGKPEEIGPAEESLSSTHLDLHLKHEGTVGLAALALPIVNEEEGNRMLDWGILADSPILRRTYRWNNSSSLASRSSAIAVLTSVNRKTDSRGRTSSQNTPRRSAAFSVDSGATSSSFTRNTSFRNLARARRNCATSSSGKNSETRRCCRVSMRKSKNPTEPANTTTPRLMNSPVSR